MLRRDQIKYMHVHKSFNCICTFSSVPVSRAFFHALNLLYFLEVQGCIQKFDWLSGARTANGIALCR